MSLPTHQNALVGKAKGGPVALTTRPIPSPGPDEVLIRVTTAGLNPHDQLIRDTGLLIKNYPWVPANDVAGEVVGLGEGVNEYAVGDTIFGQSHWADLDPIDYSGAQEYTLVRVEGSAKVPAGWRDDDMATLPSNFIAAFWSIHDDPGAHLPFPALGLEGSGDFDFSQHDIVIVGGGSQVGKLLVQVAKLDGWRSIVVVAGKKNEEELQSMGATHVVDRHAGFDEVVKQVREIVGDDCEYAIDAVSTDFTLAAAMLSNEKEGTLIVLTFGDLDKSKIGQKRAGFKQHETEGISTKPSSVEMAKKVWGALPSWVQNGDIKIPKWTTIDGLDADKVNEVMDRWRDGKAVPEHVHIRP